MRQVFLYGELATVYGPSFTIRANTIGAAMRLLEANFPGKFFKRIMQGTYRVVAGKSFEDEKAIQFDTELARSELNLGSKDLHIMPVPAGAGGGAFRVVLGIALIAAAIYFMPAAALVEAGLASNVAIGTATFGLTYTSVAMIGASLVLGGVAQLLTPVPKAGNYGSRESADERPSFMFNGAVNMSEQGGPVAVIYGRMRTGSTTGSGGIRTEDIQ